MHRISLAVAAALVLGACGSSDEPAMISTAPTTTAAAAPKPANAEPKGKLSRPEYRSIHAAYKLLAPVENAKDLGKILRVGKRACVRLTTQTELLAAVHADCVQTMRFLGRAQLLVTRKAECMQAAQVGDQSCWADLFRGLGRSARVGTVRSAAVNGVLRKRGIRGQCADAIGTKKTELAAVRRVVHDALGAAHALEAKDQAAFLRATNQLQVDLNAADAGSSAEKTLRQLTTCV